MENLQIIPLDVKGLQNKSKRNQIFQYFKLKTFDIILLQETYRTLEDEHERKKEWEGTNSFSSLSNHKCGVAILCNNNNIKLKATYGNSCKTG